MCSKSQNLDIIDINLSALLSSVIHNMFDFKHRVLCYFAGTKTENLPLSV